MKKRWIALAAAALMCMAMLSGCGKDEEKGGKIESDGEVVATEAPSPVVYEAESEVIVDVDGAE